MLEKYPSSFWHPSDLEGMARAALAVAVEWARKDEREKIASYVDGNGGTVIPGASVFASLFSRNNQPCMSGDPRDRLNRVDRRAFDDRIAALSAAIRARGE
jgi:hypothetical protein